LLADKGWELIINAATIVSAQKMGCFITVLLKC
jgi:hypothetical protein